MLESRTATRCYLGPGTVNRIMRKSFKTVLLMTLVAATLDSDPLQRPLFVFLQNRRLDRIKILCYFDEKWAVGLLRNDWEQGTFAWPQAGEAAF